MFRPFVLIVLGLIWGATVPLNKLATASDLSAVTLVFMQQFAGFLLLAVIVLIRNRGRFPRPRYFQLYVLIAILGTLLPHTFSFVAVDILQSNMMSVGIAITPLAAYAMAIALSRETSNARKLSGLLLGTVSILLLFNVSFDLIGNAGVLALAVALVPGLCYAAEGQIIAAQSDRTFDPIDTLFYSGGLAALLSLSLHLLLVGGAPTITGSVPLLALTSSGIIHVVCYLGYFALIRSAGAVYASQVAYFVTIGGFVCGWLLLSEQVTYQLFLSLCLMVGGVMLVQTTGQTKPQRRIRDASLNLANTCED